MNACRVLKTGKFCNASGEATEPCSCKGYNEQSDARFVPNVFDRCLPPGSQTSSIHNYVDDVGGGNFSRDGLGYPQPCPARLRRGQPGRASIRSGSLLALSVRTRRGACRPDCQGVALHAGGTRCADFRLDLCRVSRSAGRSLGGVGTLLAAAVMMPWLGSRKRHLAAVASSAALKADAAESDLCGYMAWIALSGLAVNAIWRKPRADPGAHSPDPARGMAGHACASARMRLI
jgi:hypothetical protein